MKTPKFLSSLPTRADLAEMRAFLLLWSTQALSSLGSSMTAFALVVWSYEAEGSALTTALLSVCSYAPYVLVSVFAGALSDRWNKKAVLLICDGFAALTTLLTLLLLCTGRLQIWHLYALNALSGLMNSVQQPASEVTTTLLTPRAQFQRAASLRALSSSVVNLATPALAAAVLGFAGLPGVIAFDLATFAVAALALAFGIRLPKAADSAPREESLLAAARAGLRFLWRHAGILHLILFLAGINLIASMYNAALPARTLPLAGQAGYGLVGSVSGAAMLAGSALAVLLPAPKRRARVICGTLLLSMSTENFLLALGRSPLPWCVGAVLGWIGIPLMNANLDALLRTSLPLEMQGRVYAARNALQFFTIPLGYLLGGALVDALSASEALDAVPLLSAAFGAGQSGAAGALLFLLGLAGTALCLGFSQDRAIRSLEG